MSLVSKAIAALFNGVSQQPATMRLPSQCEEMVNGYPTVADGVLKRPSTQHIAELAGLSGSDIFTHVIESNGGERYLIAITSGALSVFDLQTGAAQTVVDNTPGSYDSYLDVPVGWTAKETFRVVTIADYSFIVNRGITVATGALSTTEPSNYAQWFFPDTWTQAGESTRYYVPAAGTDMGTVQTMADLPALDDPTSPPSEGDYYKITGDEASGFAAYYVIFRAGVWVETHQTGAGIRLDETTMPHSLVLEGDGDFHFRQFGWVPRLFGDDNSNALPSFVGKQLTDIGYHKNRLALSAGENIVFSCAGDYGNFFRNTVTQLLDSDRVDTTVSTAKNSIINYILPSQNGLMFFSKATQFVLNVDELLTPSTVSVDVATNYEMVPEVAPINVGQDVYFAQPSGDFTRIRQYTLSDGGELSTDATDVTAHVPRYLPQGAFKLAGSSNEDLLLVLSNADGYENRVYPYKFFYSSGEKVQSAWSYWAFQDDDVIIDAEVIDSEIYFVISRSDGVFLEKMNVQSTDFPLDLDFDVLLDRRYRFVGGEKAYNGFGTTVFTLPYDVPVGDRSKFRLVHGSGATPGRVIDTTTYSWSAANVVTATGDFTSIEVLGGLNYEFLYRFSEQFFPRRDGVVTTGRYQLRTFTIYFEDTAFFKTRVYPYGIDATTESVVPSGLATFTGKTLGSAALVTGAPVFESGTYAFQIYGNSKVAVVELLNDQPFQSKFVSAEVEGFYSNRSRAM
jgi:hypothetical protein